MNEFYESIEKLSAIMGQEAFSVGVCFVISMVLFFSLLDLPLHFLNYMRLKMISAHCTARFVGGLNAPCRVHNCPHRARCCYYCPRRSLRQFLADLQKNKPHS